jgi:hypothetical protein
MFLGLSPSGEQRKLILSSPFPPRKRVTAHVASPSETCLPDGIRQWRFQRLNTPVGNRVPTAYLLLNFFIYGMLISHVYHLNKFSIVYTGKC